MRKDTAIHYILCFSTIMKLLLCQIQTFRASVYFDRVHYAMLLLQHVEISPSPLFSCMSGKGSTTPPGFQLQPSDCGMPVEARVSIDSFSFSILCHSKILIDNYLYFNFLWLHFFQENECELCSVTQLFWSRRDDSICLLSKLLFSQYLTRTWI